MVAKFLFSVGAILSSPVVVGNAIYFGSSDGNLYALMQSFDDRQRSYGSHLHARNAYLRCRTQLLFHSYRVRVLSKCASWSKDQPMHFKI
uniref:PQQ-binding-like beta-propeller repeat protein n=1 Tax=Acidicapsa acidisoli TaxID=1615681 RepID=UPI0037BECB45